jgi:hypothetical protein
MTTASKRETKKIARSTFIPSKWEENSYDEFSKTKKLTKVSAIFDLKGDLEGKALVEYLMVYTESDPSDMSKSKGTYVGLMKIEGSLGGKQGSFVVEDRGTFEAGACKSTLLIVSGSGTGDFKNISGSGHYAATHDTNSLELSYLF